MTGFQGALLMMLALAVSLAFFFVVLGHVLRRRESRELDRFGGWLARAPVGACLFNGAFMPAAVPGSGEFSGIFLILISVYKASPLLGLLRRAPLFSRLGR